MEEELAGGNSSTVARKGDKIYRNAGPWTPTIHKLLNELHRNNIPEVPTAFGIDDQGREVLSFMSGEVAPDWCSQEHIGFVLSGALDIDVAGKVVSFSEGDGIFLPSGQSSAHRATSITPGTRLVMVEEI